MACILSPPPFGCNNTAHQPRLPLAADRIPTRRGRPHLQQVLLRPRQLGLRPLLPLALLLQELLTWRQGTPCAWGAACSIVPASAAAFCRHDAGVAPADDPSEAGAAAGQAGAAGLAGRSTAAAGGAAQA